MDAIEAEQRSFRLGSRTALEATTTLNRTAASGFPFAVRPIEAHARPLGRSCRGNDRSNLLVEFAHTPTTPARDALPPARHARARGVVFGSGGSRSRHRG